MRDQYFEAFIAEAGEAKSRREVSHEQISKYRDILPNASLQYWQKEGWCCYAKHSRHKP
ncbi:GAD-like domain-containing protein [Pseudomonas syringae]|uniref:GAD-like domain-containing protein n=1 Tax=Pseudomonas syringae TaxID=317 RepID=UPI0009B125A6